MKIKDDDFRLVVAGTRKYVRTTDAKRAAAWRELGLEDGAVSGATMKITRAPVGFNSPSCCVRPDRVRTVDGANGYTELSRSRCILNRSKISEMGRENDAFVNRQNYYKIKNCSC